MTTGVPASAFGDPITDMVASDPPPRIKSAFSDLLDQALAAPRVHRTKTEVWVEDRSRREGGYWQVVD